MAKWREWSLEEERKIDELYQSSQTIEEILTEFPGRTENALRLKASRIGLKRPIPQEPNFALCSQCGRLVPQEELITEHDIETRLVTSSVTNPQYNKYNDIMIITTFVGIIIDQQENRKRELITKLVTIFRNKSNTETLLSLASHRAATMRTLLNDIDLSEMSVNRSLNILKHLGLIHRAGKTKQAKSLGGPKPTVWAIHGYKPDDITQAIVTHQRLSSPLYSESEKATQLIIDDYIASKNPKEVTREEIWPLIKKLNPGFSIKEFGDRVLSNLQKQGIKVWR